jgi:hypothetical protein
MGFSQEQHFSDFEDCATWTSELHGYEAYSGGTCERESSGRSDAAMVACKEYTLEKLCTKKLKSEMVRAASSSFVDCPVFTWWCSIGCLFKN